MKKLFWTIAIVCLLAWLTYVWPSPYRYYEYSRYNGYTTLHYNVRVNRFTGKTEYLDLEGWQNGTPDSK